MLIETLSACSLQSGNLPTLSRFCSFPNKIGRPTSTAMESQALTLLSASETNNTRTFLLINEIGKKKKKY